MPPSTFESIPVATDTTGKAELRANRETLLIDMSAPMTWYGPLLAYLFSPLGSVTLLTIRNGPTRKAQGQF